MSKQVQLRRGNTAVNSTFIGAQSELVADTQANILILHDGFTVGGHKVASKSYVDSLIAADLGNIVISGNTISTLGTNETLNISPNGSGIVKITSLTVTNPIIGNLTGSSATAASATSAVTVTANAQPNINSVGNLTSLISTGLTQTRQLYVDSGPVGQHIPPGATGAGAITADAFITVQADLYPNYFQIGTLDGFSRYEIHSEMPNTVLRLGGWQADGDLIDTPSEGIIVYGNSTIGGTLALSNGAYARIKANRLGLFAINSGLPAFAGGAYYFRVDDTELYFTSNAGVNTFHIDRQSGDTVITGNVTATTFIGNVTGSSATANNATYLGGVAAANYAKLSSPVFTGVPVLPTYTLDILPTVVLGGMIYVSNATGAFGQGAMCFGNVDTWVDVTTGNAVV